MAKTPPTFLLLTESQRIAIDEAGAALDRLKAEVQRRVQVAFNEACDAAKLDATKFSGTLEVKDGKAGFTLKDAPPAT